MVSASTMWGEKSVYKSKLSPCPTTHRLDVTRPSQVISNPQAQVLEAFHLLQGTTVDYDCEAQLTGATPRDAHRLRISHIYGKVVQGNPFTNTIHIILELLHARGKA